MDIDNLVKFIEFVHISVYHSYLSLVGPLLSVSNLCIISLMGSLPRPWAQTLISIVPSNIRTESGLEPIILSYFFPLSPLSLSLSPAGVPNNKLESILINISGHVSMLQREVPRPQTDPNEVPVCVHYVTSIFVNYNLALFF